MSVFNLDKNASIYLYGAAAIGSIIYNNLIKAGYSIAGFLDNRADELDSYYGLPVYKLDEFDGDVESVIVVAVKNVFEHEQIVKRITKQGYYNIIYKPKSILNNCGTEEDEVLSGLYDAMLDGNITDVYKIRKTYKANIYEYKDYSIIKEYNNGEIIARIPIEFIYTNNYDTAFSRWGNLSIMAFFTHVQFFRYMLGDKDSSMEYYVDTFCTESAPDGVKITQRWKENVVRNRSMILENMNLASELDSDFFIRNAPEAEWNKKGYFNLTSGKHRAAFFAAKQYKYVPLKILKTDYESYVNEEEVRRVIDYIENNNLDLTSVISNPYFLRYPTLNNEFYYNLLFMCSNYMSQRMFDEEGNVDFNTLDIIDNTDNYLGYGCHFSRMGCNVYKANCDNKELFEQVTNMLHVGNYKMLSDKLVDKNIDYIFMEANADMKLEEDGLVSEYNPDTIIAIVPANLDIYSEKYMYNGCLTKGYSKNRPVEVNIYKRM